MQTIWLFDKKTSFLSKTNEKLLFGNYTHSCTCLTHLNPKIFVVK